MANVVTCPNCGRSLNCPPAAAGKTGKCGNCGTRLTFPPSTPSGIGDDQASAPWPSIDTAPRIATSSAGPQRIEFTYRVEPENVFWSTVALLSAVVIFSIVASVVFVVVTLVLRTGAAALHGLAR